MSAAEVIQKPIFGAITAEQMAQDEKLARLVLKVVAVACRHTKGRYDARAIAEGLASGAMKLWGVLTPPDRLEATIVTRMAGQTCEIVLAGPDFDDVLPFLGVLQRNARAAGATKMALNGPRFFKRDLGDAWHVREVRYECDLAPG